MDIREKISELLYRYDKIIVMNCACEPVETLYEKWKQADACEEGGKVLLVIRKAPVIKLAWAEVCSVSDELYESFLKLYYTYEFSNRILLLNQNSQFPSLINLYLAGMLSERDFLKVILH